MRGSYAAHARVFVLQLRRTRKTRKTKMSSQTRCMPNLLSVALRGSCPSSDWKDVIAPLLVGAMAESMSFLNAGANKGFAVAEFLARFHRQDCGPSGCMLAWYNNITDIKKNTMLACGYCNDCRSGMPRSQHRVPVRIHAFELLAGNQKLLQLLFQRLHVPGEVHAVALSNSTGTLWAPVITRTGQENVAASTELLKHYQSIPTTSIDAYASRTGLQQLDWVTLDAEGWDGLIIRGGARMLRNRRIGILEFEYSAKSWVSREPVRRR